MSHGWGGFAYTSHRAGFSPGPDSGQNPEANPELADIGRLARRLVRRAVATARAEDAPVRQLVLGHLGPEAASAPVVSGSWPGYDHVNVQAGLDAWLTGDGRRHELTGLIGFRHMMFGFGDLLQAGPHTRMIGVGSVALAARDAGPDGEVLSCVQCGVYLIEDNDVRLALLLRGPDERGPSQDVTVEICAADQVVAQRVLDDIRRLAIERNVFRGQVVSFGGEVFGHGGGALLKFLDRPRVDRSEVILPAAVLDGIDHHVLGIARHADLLRASGQHLKRGVLLHGAPGTGKTHTIRYLLGNLPGTTIVIISGTGLQWITQACSVARALQPAMIVIEDVDLIAEERGGYGGQHPLLFQLLNEMDGLGADVDVTFLLTTNRADMLEEALAARPGRVDHAAELPIPDADARRGLIELYRGNLVLDLSDPEVTVARTEGVTASFLKELLRRAALNSADRLAAGPQDAGPEPPAPPAPPEPLRVIDAPKNTAHGQLLDTQHQRARGHLRGRAGQSPGAGRRRQRMLLTSEHSPRPGHPMSEPD